MRITVTQEDIDVANAEYADFKCKRNAATYFQGAQCPIAHAIRRQLGIDARGIAVTPWYISIARFKYEWRKVSKTLVNFMKNWDNKVEGNPYKKEPVPFTFILPHLKEYVDASTTPQKG